MSIPKRKKKNHKEKTLLIADKTGRSGNPTSNSSDRAAIHHHHHKKTKQDQGAGDRHNGNNNNDKDDMSKLAPALKELINAPFSRPGPAKAPAKIRDVYLRIANEASQKNVGNRPWLALSAAASFTLNSPESLAQLFHTATSSSAPKPEPPVAAAELIREVGLKCISFNGIPRSINCLGAFRAALPADVVSQLETAPTRGVSPANIAAVSERGLRLWKSVYDPFDAKLVARLADSHPDLPVHILSSHYGPLLSDPDPAQRGGLARVGRVLTSVVAIACLRAQTGVGPQVLSHVFGLRKAVEQGIHRREAEEGGDDVASVEWLASDEGSEWILRSVDGIAEAIGSNFAAGRESKL